MKFTKVRDVKSPSRANAGDAGVDFYIPKYSKEIIEELSDINGVVVDTQGIYIYPNYSINIPTGIKVVVPFGKALFVQNKSGIASKKKLIKGACVIDHNYSGEVIVNLHNIGNSMQHLPWDTKMVQMILLDVDLSEYEEISTEEYSNIMDHPENTRGEGGFGSTGL